MAFCSGHPVASATRGRPPFWVYDYANNWLLLSSYHLSEKNLRSYIFELERFQPALLSGYPSSIYLLALANEYYGRRVHPRAIYTASETLFDFQRVRIENSFGCKVFVWYGNSEMCCNIVECEKGKYHLKLEHSYVEFLDNRDRPAEIGQEGRLICTGFGNYAFPLIRYSIEDIAVLSDEESCLCGRGGRVVQEVLGRTEDYIVTPDGRFVGRLDHLFKDAVHVKLAQIIQNRIEEVIIRVVKDRDYSRKDELEISQEAAVRLGPFVEINFEYVNEIPRGSSGKYRFVISNINRDVLKKDFLSSPL
jgi:phenylacetate-CoA ligase